MTRQAAIFTMLSLGLGSLALLGFAAIFLSYRQAKRINTVTRLPDEGKTMDPGQKLDLDSVPYRRILPPWTHVAVGAIIAVILVAFGALNVIVTRMQHHSQETAMASQVVQLQGYLERETAAFKASAAELALLKQEVATMREDLRAIQKAELEEATLDITNLSCLPKSKK